MLSIVIFAFAIFASPTSAALSSACASIDPKARKDCGYPGITAAECLKNPDCCYDESVWGVKWCFFAPPKPCSSSPCKNGGSCTDSGTSFTCQCPAGFSGATCEVTPCTTSPCLNSGTCAISGSSFTCKCAAGFSGPICAVTPCTTLPCLNSGTCTISGSSFACQCAAGFSGPTCAETPCSNSPCLSGGTCTISGSSFTCKCVAGFSGPTCAARSCADIGFKIDTSVNRCYKTFQEKANWSTAFAKCSALNSNLAVISSAKEQQAITQLITAQASCDGWYTAGQRIDPSTKTDFVWKLPKTDGSSGSTQLSMSYTNWMGGQPDFWKSIESCMELQKSGNYAWNDQDCNIEYCYVCQIDL